MTRVKEKHKPVGTFTTWHKSQIFGYLLLAFLVGILVASIFSVSGLAIKIGIGVGVAVLAWGIRRRKIGFLAGCLVLVFFGGILRFNIFNSRHSILVEFTDRQVKEKSLAFIFAGYVDGEFQTNGENAQLPLKVKTISSSGKIIQVDERILVKTKSFPRYKYGDALYLEGALTSPQNFSGFDYVTYLKKEGIKTISSFPKINVINKNKLGLGILERSKILIYENIFGIKHRFESGVENAFTEPTASYINGILLGTRQNIPDDILNNFKKTGITHILAISGYNIMIIADALLIIFTFFVKRRRAFWLSVGIIIGFTILTGASASVVRASIMGLLFLFATGYGRLYDPRNSILLAGAAMVLLNPLLLIFDIGFQLSFFAVLGLLYLYPRFKERARKIPDVGGLKEIILMTLSAQIMVAPLLVYYFKQFSLVSLPVNVLVLPLVPLVMLLGFIGGLSGMLWVGAGKIIGLGAWAIASLQLAIVNFFGQLPWASVAVSIKWYTAVGVYILLIAWILRKSSKKISQ